ncbi:MAG: YceI family protein [Bacteroidetes bacterium]|nr:YceI family protein [Bacteroidota bacterium]
MRLLWLFFYLFLISPSLAQKQWVVNTELSKISFTIKNFGMNVKGGLADLNAIIRFDPNQLKSSNFRASLEVHTINTNNKKRDKHLRSEDYFDISQYARITFETIEILRNSKGFIAKGNLQIKNVTKQIDLPFTFSEHQGKGHFKSQFNLNRLDYGVGKSSWVLGDGVRVIIEVVAILTED